MAQLSISVPADLRHWVDTRVARAGYADLDEYVRALIRRDQDEYEADVRRVRALVEQGRASGVIDAEPEDILDEIIAGIPTAHG